MQPTCKLREDGFRNLRALKAKLGEKAGWGREDVGRGVRGPLLQVIQFWIRRKERFFCANLNTSEKERGEGGKGGGRKKHLKSGRLPSFCLITLSGAGCNLWDTSDTEFIPAQKPFSVSQITENKPRAQGYSPSSVPLRDFCSARQLQGRSCAGVWGRIYRESFLRRVRAREWVRSGVIFISANRH